MKFTRRADISEILPLRSRVLRPDSWPKFAHYPEDNAPDTFHFLHEIDTQYVAVGTFIPLPAPDDLQTQFDKNTYYIRLRGMAVEPKAHRQGHGKALMIFALDTIKKNLEEPTVLWFNARKIAIPFYLSLGCHLHGNEFDIPVIGPHKVMWLRLN